MIVKFCEERDARGSLESRGEIRLGWGVRMDEDLTMMERRNRWRMVEKARGERENRKWVRMTNRKRKIWIEGVK